MGSTRKSGAGQVGVWFALSVSLLSAPALLRPLQKIQPTQRAGQPRHLKSEQSRGAALRIWQELGGPYGSHSFYGLMNFAIVYKDPGDLTRASQAYQEALELSRSALGAEDRRTAAAMNRLAEALAMTGDFLQAQKLLTGALAIERAAAPQGLAMAQTLNDLAFLYTHDHRWFQAAPLLRQASRILAQWTADDSLDASTLFASVAALHSIRGRADLAEPLLRRAGKSFERNLGPNDPRLGVLLIQKGMLLLGENKLTLAAEDLTRAVGILRTSKGENSRQFAAAETSLGLVRLSQHRLDEAALLLIHARKIQRSMNAKPHPDIVGAF
jgi:tetratricopeptide (TPR) repeat protein